MLRCPGTTVIGTGKSPTWRPLASVVTSGPGPAGSFEAPSTRTPISWSSSTTFKNLGGLVALAHDLLGLEMLEAHGLDLAAEQAEHGARLVVPLLARDLLDAEPMLELDPGLDHVKQGKMAARALGAAGGKSERTLAFRRLVHHHEELPLVALLIDLPLLARLGRHVRWRFGFLWLFRLGHGIGAVRRDRLRSASGR